jgi:hypothetical protein
MNLKEYIQSEIKGQLIESVNWSEFYKMAKDTSGDTLNQFEKKYGSILDRPHVKDALKNTKDFKPFMKHINKFESVNEGIWPKSKLSDRFEFILSDELKKKFKGIFYVVGYDLYHNDKKIMVINPDKDSVTSIVNHVSRNRAIQKSESVNETFIPKVGTIDEFDLKNLLMKNPKVNAALGDSEKSFMKKSDVVVIMHQSKRFNTIFTDGKQEFEIDMKSNKLVKPLTKARKEIAAHFSKSESVNEASRRATDFYGDTKHGKALHSFLKGKWDSKKVEKYLEKLGADSDVINARLIDFISKDAGLDTRKYKTLGEQMPALIKQLEVLYKDFLTESVNESEQLDEKLITFSNRAPYGQVVFMAGGAGSGKGFAINNFIDSAGFKVRDVDEMKKVVGELDKLGKFSIDAWFKKYANNLSEEERNHVEEFVVGKGMTISDVASNLKNPNNVAALHYIVDAMGLKDKWLINMLSGKTNKETLPNLLFDITAKKVNSITEVIKPLVDAGYDPKNIHLIWVLTNYHLAVQQNKDRARVVPDDILLGTHEGAAKTIWGILTSGLPKGLNGRIDVILNNRENTVTYKDSNGNEMKGAVAGFLSLPVKKQGGGVLPEKVWKDILYKWVVDNGPKTIDLRKPLDQQIKK